MAAVKLAFTWLGVRKTLAPEQRTTAARAFHADRELLSAVSAHHRHGVRGADECGWSRFSPSWRSAVAPA
jgi:hypothetical protein